MINNEEKKGFKYLVKEYLNTSLILSGIATGLLAWGVVETRLFTSAEHRVKTEEHISIPVNEVTLFRQNDTTQKQGKRLITLLDSINKSEQLKDSLAKINTTRVNKSRKERDSVNNLILITLDNIQKDIKEVKVKQESNNKILDSIKNQ